MGDAYADSILVVDDDPANLLAIEAALSGFGHRLVMARSGQEALRQLLEHDFALVLLDVQMPGIDGYDTATLIRQRPRTRHVPIIFITAHHRNTEEILRGYALGAVDYMFKPILAEVLRAKASVFVELQRQAAQVRELERRAEAARLLEAQQAWEATRLVDENRRKDEFLAVLGHELRNPLSPIVSSLELMRRHEFGDPGLAMARDAMVRQVRHLTRLVDDLLDVARINSGKVNLQRVETSLVDAVRDAVEAMRPALESREQELRVDIPASRVVVEGDPVRLTQIVGNLLSNASRYSERGAQVRVQAGQRDGWAFVRVEDDGCGLEAEHLARIFEPFMQVRVNGSGLGLELALVHRLVELHDGRVSATSRGPGCGSTFEVSFPLVMAEARPASSADSDEGPPEGRDALRVVVIDDDDDVRMTTRMLLRAWGHRVDEAQDGARGVDLVAELRPDVVLIDIGMPGLTGDQVAARIRERLGERRPHLVALTGYGSLSDAASAQFDEHLVKPVEPKRLDGTLRRIRAG